MNPTDRKYTHPRQWESPYCGYSANSDKMSHTMKGTSAELEHRNPASHRSYRLNSNHLRAEKATDPDGEPVELSEEDEELARKRRELQRIEEQISLKKATIAMKKVEPFLKAKTPQQMFEEEQEEDLSRIKLDNSHLSPFMSRPTGEKDVGFPSGKWSSTYNNRPLKERVNVILQRRWPDAKAFSTPSDHLPPPNLLEKTNTSTLNKDDHPLKLRVKALINRRLKVGDLDSNGEVPVVKPHPPSQSSSATVDKNDMVVKGFQRFISLLNKGVDIEMLTKIVNDDKELPPTGQELLHSQPPVSEQKADVCKSESQQLQIGAVQSDRQSCSEERKTELLNQEISHGGSKRDVQPEMKFTCRNDRGGRHFVSSGTSRSPSVDEKKPKLEPHQGQLQFILNSIGLSMEANDLCKPAERTQERLNGLKDDMSTGVSERRRQHLKRHHSPSSSSTSVSGSPSSSPSHHKHSSSRTPRDSREPTQRSRDRNSRKRSKEKERKRDSERDKNRIDSVSDSPCSPSRHQHSSSKAPRDSREQTLSSRSRYSRKRSKKGERERDCDGDKNMIDSRGRSRDQRPSPENPEYHGPHPDTASALSTYNPNAPAAYTSVQHSEYTAYQNYYSNGTSLYDLGYFSFVNPLYPSANTGALLGQADPNPHPPAGCNNDPSYFDFNSDLSQSEGQTAQQSGPRYLLAIDTETSSNPDHCLLKLTKGGYNSTPHPKARAEANERRLAYLKREENRQLARIRQLAKIQAEADCARIRHLASIQAQADCSSANNQNDPGRLAYLKREEKRQLARIQAQADCSSANNQSDPGQMQTSHLSSGITTNTPHPEPPVEASAEVQERALPTEVEIKANLKKTLAAFNEKMKHQVPKPTETQPNVNDW